MTPMRNPMQMMNNQMMNMMRTQFMNNPLFQQAQQMSQGKSPAELQQVCMNICKSKGLDFNQALQQFQSQFPGMK